MVPVAGSFRLSRTKDGRLKVYLKSRPEGNKANIELLKGLSKLLKCDVSLVSGARSRRKILEVAMDKEKWASFVESVEE